MVLHHTWDAPKGVTNPLAVSFSHDRSFLSHWRSETRSQLGVGWASFWCLSLIHPFDTTSQTGPHLLVLSGVVPNFPNPRPCLPPHAHCGRPCDGSGISSARFCPPLPAFRKQPPAFRGGVDRSSLWSHHCRGSYIEPGLCGSPFPISSCEI